MTNINQRILLRERPESVAGPEHFSIDSIDLRSPAEGEVMLETILLSIDPAMRVWISEDPGYVPPVRIGEVMRAGGIGRVVASRAEGLLVGDLVQGRIGWQSYPTVDAAGLQKLDPTLGSPMDWLLALGTPGLTAYFGLLTVGKAKEGETVLVSAASGAVGQMVGQIAKLKGCTAVGIAGSSKKCDFITRELGFDAAIDYRAADDINDAISRVCPDGIDVYFDNVGGPILDAALANLRARGRVVICGRISQTARREGYGLKNTGVLIGKCGRMEGFIVSNFASSFDDARKWLSAELKSGRLRQRFHLLDGLEQAPAGLRMLFQGENFGKLAVRMGE